MCPKYMRRGCLSFCEQRASYDRLKQNVTLPKQSSYLSIGYASVPKEPSAGNANGPALPLNYPKIGTCVGFGFSGYLRDLGKIRSPGLLASDLRELALDQWQPAHPT